jgi:hypothetical protein
MKPRFHRSLQVIAGALACVAVAAMSLWSPTALVRTEDQNGDGRPDIWRTYNDQGQLSEVAVDTNFDGRADVREYYERGALVRRESDRDFNDRVDLVQEFDATTRESVRSVVDVDFDGTADLLVLFRGGQPVFSKWAHSVAPVVATGFSALNTETTHRTGNDQLEPLQDPFSADLSVRAVRVLADGGDTVGLTTSGGLPASPHDGANPLESSSAVSGSCVSHPAPATIAPYSPRGPPASSRLA